MMHEILLDTVEYKQDPHRAAQRDINTDHHNLKGVNLGGAPYIDAIVDIQMQHNEGRKEQHGNPRHKIDWRQHKSDHSNEHSKINTQQTRFQCPSAPMSPLIIHLLPQITIQTPKHSSKFGSLQVTGMSAKVRHLYIQILRFNLLLQKFYAISVDVRMDFFRVHHSVKRAHAHHFILIFGVRSQTIVRGANMMRGCLINPGHYTEKKLIHMTLIAKPLGS
mmetsp:Transcript_16053/g.24649  ORF Transcript_16053/g.24649 Transcript_16053/m.24649 type:complete len:220 (-) Transcript_16053:1012-1671(-)